MLLQWPIFLKTDEWNGVSKIKYFFSAEFEPVE